MGHEHHHGWLEEECGFGLSGRPMLLDVRSSLHRVGVGKELTVIPKGGKTSKQAPSLNDRLCKLSSSADPEPHMAGTQEACATLKFCQVLG